MAGQYLLSEWFSQDPLENYFFNSGRGVAGAKTQPSMLV